MTIIEVKKLDSGQFDVTLRMTEAEGLELAQLIVQAQEKRMTEDGIAPAPSPPEESKP